MATTTALQQALAGLDNAPPESRDLIECMCTLFLLYLQIGYLTEDEISLPPGVDAARNGIPHWREDGWDERIVDALPWLPSMARSSECETHITPGAFGCTFRNYGFRKSSKDLFGHLVEEEDQLPAYALPLTDGLEFADHWMWDAKSGLVRLWNYEQDVNKFDDMSGTPVADKFQGLIAQITELKLIPWIEKLYLPPNLALLQQSRNNGRPNYALEADTFVVAKNAYLGAGWGG